VHGLVVEVQLPLIGSDDAGDDLAQRGLACTVLAD
jgi:hypothetical protein